MFSTGSVLGLALLGLSGSAFASDLDEVAPFGQVAVEQVGSDGPTVQHRRQGGGSKATRSHASHGKGQTVHRRPATHGARPQGGTQTTRPPARPPASDHHRPAATARPPHHPGPVPVHARPAPHHRGPVVRYRHVRPYHGVFVYGPRPATHVHYVDATGPVGVAQSDLPERAVDRNGSVALGVRGGSLVSGSDGVVHGDAGIGGFLRVRPDETVGLELAATHHAGRYPATDTRIQNQVAGSVELFAFPWTRVSPYVLGGVTWNSRNETQETVNDGTTVMLENSYAQWGLHGGLGLEFALGKSAAIDLEARTIGWLNQRPGDAALAVQATGGLLFHF